MSTRRAMRPHYVSHNKVTRLPRAFVYLDTEALRRNARAGEVQSFRLAVVAIDRRKHHSDGWREREWSEHGDALGLWTWITERCQAKARTVLVAHNLAYDLRISDAFRMLPALGWEAERVHIGESSASATFKCGERTLVLTDSLSWFNTSLAKVGAAIGIPKLDLPDWEDSDDAWLARCRRDVTILADAYRRALDWVRAEDLGNWKPSGAGQAWAAYRHRFMTYPPLVHDHQPARDAERRAGWTGRCEAWRHGKVRGGPFTEWDFNAAYARIGAECDVPVQLCAELSQRSLFKLDAMSERHAVLAECEVVTDVPIVPALMDGRIVWPVGAFTSTLWNNEIALARENGATVHPTRAWWYVKRPELAMFCNWCLSTLDANERDVDPVVRLIVKHWSRALIGRFAARYEEWTEYGSSPWEDVALGWLRDVGADELVRFLQLGHRMFRLDAEVESQDAVPSVMTYVMAEARCRLWRAVQAAGAENVVYMDTDSLIVGPAGNERLREARLSGFRVKSAWNTVEVFGPRQIVLSGALRAAGVAKSAERVSDDTWESDIWTGIRQSLASGEPDVVRVTRRTTRLRGVDNRRLHLPHGLTAPFELNTVLSELAI
jgi:hypothetical protein